jgi:hypothetical protein
MAASKSGMHIKTAQKYEHAEQLPRTLKKPHTWVTCTHPFAADWP